MVYLVKHCFIMCMKKEVLKQSKKKINKCLHNSSYKAMSIICRIYLQIITASDTKQEPFDRNINSSSTSRSLTVNPTYASKIMHQIPTK